MLRPRTDKHRIDRVKFILQTDDALATKVQQRCSQVFHQQLQAQLSEVLSQYGPMQIDTLTLEVGQISWTSFDTQIRERVLQQLSLQLSKCAAMAHSTGPERDSLLTPASAATKNLSDTENQSVTAVMPSLSSELASKFLQTDHTAHTAVQLRFDLPLLPLPDEPQSLLTDPPAARFESYLHSGQLAKPQWLGAGDWLLAQLQAAPDTWRPMLARCCVQNRPLQRLLQLYSPATLRNISHGFSPSDTPLPLPANDMLAPYLILGALRFFQQHPAQPMPVADGLLEADTVQPELALWLECLQTAPPTPILRQWLRPLFHQPKLHGRLVRYLSTSLVNSLQALLKEEPLTSQQINPAIQPATLAIDSCDKTAAQAQQDAVPDMLEKLPAQHRITQFEPSSHSSAFVADDLLETDSLQPELALWIERLQTEEPPTPILRQWLRPLFHQPTLRSLLIQHLPISLTNRLQALLKAHPLVPQQAGRVLGPTSATLQHDPLVVSNAGIGLLWPLLPGLFTRLGLLQNNAFIDHEAQINAVCWLDWLIWADDVGTVERTPLTRYLCGLPLDTPIDPWRNPPDTQRADMARWLSVLPPQLPGLHRCSVEDLRHLFLQRPGCLLQQNSHWTLHIEPDASDILLRQLPWPINQILLPWLAYPLAVTWSAKGGL